MPQLLPVPDKSVASYRIPLNGTSYIINYRFNGIDKRWYFDLYNEDESLLKAGVKVMENQSLLARYLLEGFEGDIICEKVNNTLDPVGRNNLGIDKEYELVYYTEQELDSD